MPVGLSALGLVGQGPEGFEGGGGKTTGGSGGGGGAITCTKGYDKFFYIMKLCVFFHLPATSRLIRRIRCSVHQQRIRIER